jgi:KaiC/GvpD/RAD55 family RecA-like ATPase
MAKEANKGLSKLKNLSEYVALAVVNAQKYQKINVDIIKEMVKAGTPGVYVTLNRPYDNIKALFAKEKIDTKNVIFIDGVSKTVGGKVEKRDDCLYIGGPKGLSDISLAMDQAIMAIPKGDKFLFFDSLSTLLLYHDVSVVAQFVHFISGKMRVWKVKGIIISLRRNKDQELIEELQSFCDLTLNI